MKLSDRITVLKTVVDLFFTKIIHSHINKIIDLKEPKEWPMLNDDSPSFVINFKKIYKKYVKHFLLRSQSKNKKNSDVRTRLFRLYIDDDTFSHSSFIGCDNRNVFFITTLMNLIIKLYNRNQEFHFYFTHCWSVDVQFHWHLIEIYNNM